MTEAPLLRMETFNAELERTKDCAAEYGAIISYLRPDSDYEIVACPAQHVLVVMRGDRRYRDDIQHFIADHEHCSRRDDVDDTRHGSGSGHRQDPVPPSRECLHLPQALPAGWDSYGSEPITPASIDSAAGDSRFQARGECRLPFLLAETPHIWYHRRMDRTMRVQLQTTPEQASLLAETTRQFTAVFNAVAAHGYEKGEKNGVTLHHALYYPQRAMYPDLVSDHHIQARMKATEAVKSVLALAKKGRKVSTPRATSCPPRYNVHTFKVVWERGIVTLSTTGGRQRIPFRIPAYAAKYAGAKVCTADLINRGGEWWLHIVVDIPAPDIAPNDAVIGVDLGVAQPAVTSNARFLGKKRWRAVEARRFRLRRALQKSSSKSAKRHLRKIGRKQRRFRRDCDHVLSKQIVAAVEPGGTIVVENLTNIRARVKTRKGRQARRIHGWSFAQCRGFIAYKAEEQGSMVAGVDPRHTSQTCHVCGHVARTNRRSRSLFRCRSCGYTAHADFNASVNIAAKYRADPGLSGFGGLPVKQPIVGGGRPGVPAAHKPPALAGGT